MKLNQILLILFCTISFVSADFEIETFVQPLYLFEEKGSWPDSGEYEFSIHRAQVDIRFSRKLTLCKINSKIEADFAKQKFNRMLRDAYIGLNFIPQLKVKTGRFKTPFGANELVSPLDMWTIYRSFTTDFINDILKVGGYQNGGILYGSFLKYFSYSLGVFDYENNRVKGVWFKDIFDFPVFKLGFEYKKIIKASYMFATPQAGRSMVNGLLLDRFILHDFMAELHIKKVYELFIEGFIGIDSSTFADTHYELLGGARENIAYSFYVLNTFKFPEFRKCKVRFSSGFEYLNGLNYAESIRENRSFYYSLVFASRVDFRKNFFLQFSYDDRYDENFKSVHYKRIGTQMTFKYTFDDKREKKNDKKKKSKKKKNKKEKDIKEKDIMEKDKNKEQDLQGSKDYESNQKTQ